MTDLGGFVEYIREDTKATGGPAASTDGRQPKSKGPPTRFLVLYGAAVALALSGVYFYAVGVYIHREQARCPLEPAFDRLPSEVVFPCQVPTPHGDYVLSAIKYGHPVPFSDAHDANSTSYVSISSVVEVVGSSLSDALVSFSDKERYPDGTRTRWNSQSRDDVALVLEAADVSGRCLVATVLTVRIPFDEPCKTMGAVVQVIALSGDRRTMDHFQTTLETRVTPLPCADTDYKRRALVLKYLRDLDADVPTEWNCDTHRRCGQRVESALSTIRVWLV